MAEIIKSDFDPSSSCSREIGLEETSNRKMGVLDQNNIVLDMETLSHVADREVNVNAKRSLSLNFMRTLSRKGSQKGGERKPPSEREAADTRSKGGQGFTGEKSVDLSTVAPITTDQSTVMISTMDEIRSRRYNRCNSNVGKHSPWIDPRRVLLVFATLSSMGTIILIYFTLSIANINQDGAHTQ